MAFVDVASLREELRTVVQEVLTDNFATIGTTLQEDMTQELRRFFERNGPNDRGWLMSAREPAHRAVDLPEPRHSLGSDAAQIAHHWLPFISRDDDWVTDAFEIAGDGHHTGQEQPAEGAEHPRAPASLRANTRAVTAVSRMRAKSRARKQVHPVEGAGTKSVETSDVSDQVFEGAIAAGGQDGEVREESGKLDMGTQESLNCTASSSKKLVSTSTPKKDCGRSMSSHSGDTTGISKGLPGQRSNTHSLANDYYLPPLARMIFYFNGNAPKSVVGGALLGFARSPYFEYVTSFLVIVNAITIGIQTDIEARDYKSGSTPQHFLIIEYMFVCIFTFELALRLYVYRCDFWLMKGNHYNIMDFVLVSLQLLEVALDPMPQNISFLRVFRIFRLLRVVRLVRILRHIRELRTLIVSIMTSLRSLLWTMVLLLLIIYMFSLYFTELVKDHLHKNESPSNSEELEDLKKYFGGVGISMLYMFECLFGGQDWDVFLQPLRLAFGDVMVFPFLLYISFSELAILNVVTGVFVDNVLVCAKKDQDIFLLNNVRELFQQIGGVTCEMDWRMFENLLHTPQMKEAFKAINVDPSEARGLFKLLDMDNSGVVNAEEFLCGCMKLRGPAKALDLAILNREIRRMETSLMKQR
mmetsp:Transcript_117842/g.334107  ORF Transcript_117842/g.334107 Transcript_117842/m.334107 type:complete len:640 (-) Transcript_117842:58-1977(-)